MVAASLGFALVVCGAGGWRADELPGHLGRIRYVQSPHIVEGAHAVAAAEDVDAVAVQAGGVGAPLAGLALPADFGLAPAEVDGVEHVDVVVVCRPVTTAEDDEFFAYGCAGHGAEGDGYVAAYVGGGEVEGVGVENV